MSNVKDIKVRRFPIRLDSKDRELVFDLNAFAEIEEAYGDIDLALQGMEKGSIKALRLLLWAGLLHEDEELTVKDVGKLLDMAGVEDLSKILISGLSAYMPDNQEEIKNPTLETVPQENPESTDKQGK